MPEREIVVRTTATRQQESLNFRPSGTRRKSFATKYSYLCRCREPREDLLQYNVYRENRLEVALQTTFMVLRAAM